MADPRFFARPQPLSLEAILELTGAHVSGAPDRKKTFVDVAPLDQATGDHISFYDNPKYQSQFMESKAGACFARTEAISKAPAGMIVLITSDPYTAYAQVAQKFYPYPVLEPTRAASAAIDPSATLGKDVRIDAHAVIGKNVEIGDHSWIGANTIIGDGVVIGAQCRIGANATITHSLIGQRVVIYPGAHIGQDGFGYAVGKTGLLKVPQLGRVVIEDNVEIGAGTCIDRGAGPDTLIGTGSKIDNLVQIGHNVRIGRNVVIVSQVGLSGSTVIEDGVQLGGQAGVAGHLTIGKGARIAAKGGILSDIPAGSTVGGFPAQPIRDWHRQTVILKKMIERKRGDHDD